MTATPPLDRVDALEDPPSAVSAWITVDQARIDAFAAATGDHQFIHVDPARAAETTFGGTIAHGLLTLSLVPAMADDALPGPSPAPVRMAVNYGYNRVRFPAPVRAGARIRARFRLVADNEVAPGRWDRITHVTVEIEGETRPALVAEMISSVFV